MGQAASTPARAQVRVRAPVVRAPVDRAQVPPAEAKKKRVIARNVKIERLTEPPKDAAVYYFETARGRRVCWKLGSQTAKEFMASNGGVTGADLQFFKGSTLRVFFPTTRDPRGGATSYATKTFKNNGNITLEKVMRCVEATAAAAIAHHLQAVLKQTRGTTTADVARVLKNTTVCHVLLRRVGGGNQVYVRTTGGMAA